MAPVVTRPLPQALVGGSTVAMRWSTTIQPSSLKRGLNTALFFPGHGVQRVGMANTWMSHFPRTTTRHLDEMDSILGFKLSQVIRDGPNSRLNQTQNAQPAVMAVSVLILRILEDEFNFDIGSRVDVTLGHSLGEFAALVASRHLQFPDALRLVRRRAEVMAQCTRRMVEQSGDTYGMVALICEPDHLESLLRTVNEFLGLGTSHLDDTGHPPIRQVMVANINSPNQIVLSGSIERIRVLLVQLRQFGGHDPRAVRLKSDSPFHSPVMLPAAEDMKIAMQEVDITFPGIVPCISNVSALPFKSKQDLKHLCQGNVLIRCDGGKAFVISIRIKESSGGSVLGRVKLAEIWLARRSEESTPRAVVFGLSATLRRWKKPSKLWSKLNLKPTASELSTYIQLK